MCPPSGPPHAPISGAKPEPAMGIAGGDARGEPRGPWAEPGLWQFRLPCAACNPLLMAKSTLARRPLTPGHMPLHAPQCRTGAAPDAQRSIQGTAQDGARYGTWHSTLHVAQHKAPHVTSGTANNTAPQRYTAHTHSTHTPLAPHMPRHITAPHPAHGTQHLVSLAVLCCAVLCCVPSRRALPCRSPAGFGQISVASVMVRLVCASAPIQMGQQQAARPQASLSSFTLTVEVASQHKQPSFEQVLKRRRVSTSTSRLR